MELYPHNPLCFHAVMLNQKRDKYTNQTAVYLPHPSVYVSVA